MKLYGTTTSPFVRRVRVVAAEVGESVERIDTATDAGQALLREVTPIRKVPVAVVDGRTLFDSRVIIDWLTTTRGFGQLAPPRDRWRELNLVNAIDAALDAVIQVFYLRRDGVPVDGTPFHTRQFERADTIFRWLAGELASDGRGFGREPGHGLGLAEISLVCALDWMDFRASYPTDRAGRLAGVRAAWADRPSLASTRPHA
jgi:glutathione S-transferase